MVEQVIVHVIAAVVLFGGGVWVGAENAPSVGKAIAALQQAEKNAQATLALITTHKAS